jgi:hypothetical protein
MMRRRDNESSAGRRMALADDYLPWGAGRSESSDLADSTMMCVVVLQARHGGDRQTDIWNRLRQCRPPALEVS